MLLTYKEYCRQKGAEMKGAERIWKCQLSMARIKTVIGERSTEFKLKTLPAFAKAFKKKQLVKNEERIKRNRMKLHERTLRNQHSGVRILTLHRKRKKIMFKGWKPVEGRAAAPTSVQEEE